MVFTRVSLMFVVIAVLCAGAFALGGAAAVQAGPEGVPPNHPIALAMRFHQELDLTGDQTTRIGELKEAMAKDFAPFHEKVESLQRRVHELQQSGKADPASISALQHEGDELTGKMRPMFDRYARSLFELLTPEQREKLAKLAEAHANEGDPREFVLMFIMQAREQLGVNPQQFTKLQYLQADFIRAFAPLREQMEMTQMEAQEKYGKVGKEPPPEFMARVQALQKKVKDLQAQFSERAVKEVLQPNQQAKLSELLGGDRRSGKSGS